MNEQRVKKGIKRNGEFRLWWLGVHPFSRSNNATKSFLLYSCLFNSNEKNKSKTCHKPFNVWSVPVPCGFQVKFKYRCDFMFQRWTQRVEHPLKMNGSSSRFFLKSSSGTDSQLLFTKICTFTLEHVSPLHILGENVHRHYG